MELTFAEPLPPQCPPNDAVDVELVSVFRLLDSAVPGPDAFKSQNALGLPAPQGIDLCRWASCSLVLDAKKQKKFPRFKNTHHWAAEITVPVGAGRSKQTSSNHIDFWCGLNFKIKDAVSTVVSI